jgi:hypothetical protein
MALAFSPRSGGLMVIETFLEGRGRGGGPPLWTGLAQLRGNHDSTDGGPHDRPRTSPGQAMGTSREGQQETADGNHETDCHDWSFGPQIGDRSAKYRGRIQSFSDLSYKGSIRRVARPALGSEGQ